MGDNLDDNDWLVEKTNPEEVKADWIAEDDDEDGASDNDVSIDEDEEEANVEKKMKRKQKFEALKEKKRQKLLLEEDLEEDPAHNQLSPEEMLATIDLHYPEDLKMKNNNEYSVDDFFCPALDPSAVTESTTKTFCPFTRALSAILPNYKKLLLETPEEEQEKGSPTLLIICSGAIRATEIIKSLSSKLIKCKIAKLFAKHFKITEQIEFLSKEYFPVAIGTPNRVLKLMELGALQLNRTEVILVDYTADIKNFNILTLPEVVKDFYEFLYHDSVHKERKHLKIALVKDAAPKTTGTAPVAPKKNAATTTTTTTKATTVKKDSRPPQQQNPQQKGTPSSRPSSANAQKGRPANQNNNNNKSKKPFHRGNQQSQGQRKPSQQHKKSSSA